MKRTMLMIFAAVLAWGAEAQTTDTILSRCSRYHYSEWYDQCDHFSHPADHLLYPHTTFSFGSPIGYGNDDQWSLLVSDFTAEPMQISGIAVMVPLDHQPQYTWTGGMMERNYRDSVRVPEYVMLYQIIDKDSTEVLLLDSVRWDTAAVHVLRLPQNEWTLDIDSLQLYCGVCEVYFNHPLTVSSHLLIGGTMFNNGFDTASFLPCHEPTDYLFVKDEHYGCDTCRGHYRRLYFSHPDSGTVADPNCLHHRSILGGPFLPILYNPQQQQQQVNVLAKANNPFWGHVTGSGNYLAGDSVLLTATPASDFYRFLGWEDGVGDTARVVVPVSDTVFTAWFAPSNAIVSPSAQTIDFKVVPNPARDRATVSVTAAGRYTLTLYESSGRQVLETAFDGTGCQIDTRRLAAGHYLLVLQAADSHSTGTRSLIINR